MNAASRPTPERQEIENLFAQATGACPKPERWARLAAADLAADESERLLAHAAECPMCTAELELAREFVSGPPAERSPELEQDLAAIRDHLEANRPTRTHQPADGDRQPGRVLSFPRRWRASVALLAAAALAVAVGVGLRINDRPIDSDAPELPTRTAPTAQRSSTVDGLAPIGDLDRLPTELVWSPIEGAAAYRLVVLAVDDTILWRTELAEPRADLSPAVISLSPAVTYAWQVEAIDSAGERLARSERVSFRARPN